jgi:hypothetical protein
MSKMLAVLLVLLILGCCGCRPAGPRAAGPPVNPPPALTAPPENELPRIREAVRELVKETYPNSAVEGVWTLMFIDNYCIAGADTKMGAQRWTVDMLVRLYVRENGSRYWRAEALEGGCAAFLSRSAAPKGTPAP